jgi:bifunctional UDP-N-acetylglucosamine pyrophosphorylase/glucosamine-1-phosphate N-acetyltransferase
MESQQLAVVVLAAGLGKRMVSQQPKVLNPLAGLPLAAHVLRALVPLNPSQTVVVVGRGADQVKTALGDGYGPDNAYSIEYVTQQEQLGTGHAVLMAEPILHDYRGPVLVMYGDTPLLRSATLSALMNRHRQARAVLTMLTCIAADPSGYGRVVRDQGQNLVGVVEERAATLVQRAISEINSGVYVFDAQWLWPHLEKIELNQQGEYYLTDLIGMAVKEDRDGAGGPHDAARRGSSPGSYAVGGVITFTLDGLDEAMGINSRVQLAEAEHIVQHRLRQKWMEVGVTMLLPETVYLGIDAVIGADTVLYPGVVLEGQTYIGSNCMIGPNTHVVNSTIGDDCCIVASMIEGSKLERGVTVGPYSHLRPGTDIGEDVHLGNFAEVKGSTLERGVHMGHFSYVGDAFVGEDTNIGAGTVTVNYDGVKKNRTTIGKKAFIGSGTMLRAPVEVGEGATTGAGSVVTKDVPPNSVVMGVPARVVRQTDQEKEEGKQ